MTEPEPTPGTLVAESLLQEEWVYGWLSKLWSPVGSPKYYVPYCTKDPKRGHNFDKDPKRGHNFDNHPSTYWQTCDCKRRLPRLKTSGMPLGCMMELAWFLRAHFSKRAHKTKGSCRRGAA